jgi:hypothetical protein
MLLYRRSGETAGIAPEAVAALSAEYGRPTHHLERGFRAPSAAYGVSLGALLPRFEAALSAVEAVLTGRPFEDRPNLRWDETYLEAYRLLLYALAEHLQDCRNILDTLFPLGTRLSDASAAIAYTKAVEPYRRRIAPIVNHMKHKQGRMHSVISRGGAHVLLEYFVDGVGTDGTIGPAIEVHPDGQSAIDVWTDLRFHFAHVYILSFHLSRATESIMGEGVDIEQESQVSEDGLASLANRIMRLPLFLTPDAVAPPLAAVHLRTWSDGSRRLRISYPEAGVILGELSEPMLTTARLVGDGVSRTFAFPYMRKAREARERGLTQG